MRASRLPPIAGLVLCGAAVGGQAWFAAPRGGTASSVSLFTSANPSTLGQPLALTAAVTPSATGKVTFYDGAAILGVAPVVRSYALLTTTALAAGLHTLRAHYTGDSTFFPADSPPLAQTVTGLPANGFQQIATGVSSSGSDPVVADFNNDGKPDLALKGIIWLGKGDGTFVRYGDIYPAQTQAQATAADLNGDGIPDLVVVYLGISSNAVAVLPGNGDGTFRAPSPINLGYASSALVSDFNGDGNPDLLITGYYPSQPGATLNLVLGNGDGTFRPPQPLSATGPVLAIADFNGDGKPDLVVRAGNLTDFNATTISVLLGNGDGSFRPPVSYMFPGGGNSAVVGDFNGDGKPDLAVSTGYLNILLGNGDGTFQQVNHPLYGSGSSLAAGDFNGDGLTDITQAGQLWVSNGDGTFQPPIAVGNVSGLIVTGDFNGDGRTDFVACGGPITTFLAVARPDLTIVETHTGSLTPGSVATYNITVSNRQFAATSGAVTVSATLPPGLTPISIGGPGWTCFLANLACGRSDSLAAGAAWPPIVVTASIGANAPGSISSTATLTGGGDANSSNNAVSDTTVVRAATVTLSSATNPATLGQPVILTAAVTPSATGRVTFYDGVAMLGTSPVEGGKATFTALTLTAGMHSLHARFISDLTSAYGSATSANVTQSITQLPANGFQPVITYPAPGDALYIALADMNGDGKVDLAIAGDRYIAVMLGKGDGTFMAPITAAVPSFIGPSGCSLAAADFNGDGKPDLLLSYGLYTYLLLGNGDGTLQPASLIASTAGLPAIGDFNGDGKADLAFVSGSILTVRPGNGDGTFGAPLNYTLPEPFDSCCTSFLLAGDFNGDGKTDLAIPTNPAVPLTTSNVTVLLGNGDGTFQPGVSSPAGYIYLIGSIFAADFNGDGKPDLAINYFGYTQVTALLGKGDGTFVQSPVSYPGTLLGVSDLNGDGKPDLVTFIPGSGGELQVHLGNGDGTFQGVIEVPAGGGPGRVVIADFNGDGRADIAVANSGSRDLGVLLGSSLVPPEINLTVWRPSNGTWYVRQPGGSIVTQQWGLPGDIPVAGDFDGDGRLDYAVWRPMQGYWYVLPSGPAALISQQWGLPGDIPVPGDFDGDGRTDYAVWRPSNGTWYILSSGTGFAYNVQWGLPGDIPVAADFNGDGKADFAVWRPSEGNWYVMFSNTRQTIVQRWGLSGDIPVAADFDGDGYADYAVWRPSNGTWYIIPSTHPTTPMIVQWGLPGDIPLPRDYDGDGKADLAVWRPADGTWYIVPTTSPTAPLTVQWGLPKDVPIFKPAGN